MDFTVCKRKNNLINFMNQLSKPFSFDKQYLTKGVEGKIYLAKFKNSKIQLFIIKQLYLTDTNQILKLTSEQLYKFFLTPNAFTNSLLTEPLVQTLTNQLILQNICPHYVMNYYWDKNKDLLLFNEFVNHNTFHHWAKQTHSFQEWNNAIFQIIIGLLSIKRYYNMLHTDLHTGNILVQTVKPGGYWIYTIDKYKYYLPNLGFVFLINDFGFSWIPHKTMPVKFHYNDTLRFINNNGLHFYDIQVLFCWLYQSVYNYQLPLETKQLIKNLFSNEEQHIMSSKFFSYNKTSTCPKNTHLNTKISYTGLNTNLTSTLFNTFYPIYKKKLTGKKIESYSLDKKFNTTKLPKHFRKLLY
jgi:hypothetical protein